MTAGADEDVVHIFWDVEQATAITGVAMAT